MRAMTPTYFPPQSLIVSRSPSGARLGSTASSIAVNAACASEVSFKIAGSPTILCHP